MGGTSGRRWQGEGVSDLDMHQKRLEALQRQDVSPCDTL